MIRIEQVARIRTLQSDCALQGQPRQQVRAACADREPRRLHALSGRKDVGTLNHEVGRNARRDGIRRGGWLEGIGKHMGQVGAESAHEYPEPSLGVRPQRFDLRQFGLGFTQTPACGVNSAQID